MRRVPFTQYVQQQLRHHLKAGMIAIDATLGNGHDALFLARHIAPNGQLFAFDIQRQAIDNSYKRLQEAGMLSHSTLIHAGHETMAESIPAPYHGNIDLIMFNLGYLPGADKTCITRTTSTLQALHSALHLLAAQGHISIIAYPGHPGGDDETKAVMAWAKKLDSSHITLNIEHPPQQSATSPVWLHLKKILCQR